MLLVFPRDHIIREFSSEWSPGKTNAEGVHVYEDVCVVSV